LRGDWLCFRWERIIFNNSFTWSNNDICLCAAHSLKAQTVSFIENITCNDSEKIRILKSIFSKESTITEKIRNDDNLKSNKKRFKTFEIHDYFDINRKKVSFNIEFKMVDIILNTYKSWFPHYEKLVNESELKVKAATIEKNDEGKDKKIIKKMNLMNKNNKFNDGNVLNDAYKKLKENESGCDIICIDIDDCNGYNSNNSSENKNLDNGNNKNINSNDSNGNNKNTNENSNDIKIDNNKNNKNDNKNNHNNNNSDSSGNIKNNYNNNNNKIENNYNNSDTSSSNNNKNTNENSNDIKIDNNKNYKNDNKNNHNNNSNNTNSSINNNNNYNENNNNNNENDNKNNTNEKINTSNQDDNDNNNKIENINGSNKNENENNGNNNNNNNKKLDKEYEIIDLLYKKWKIFNSNTEEWLGWEKNDFKYQRLVFKKLNEKWSDTFVGGTTPNYLHLDSHVFKQFKIFKIPPVRFSNIISESIHFVQRNDQSSSGTNGGLGRTPMTDLFIRDTKRMKLKFNEYDLKKFEINIKRKRNKQTSEWKSKKMKR
jgi:hypothetical protein